MSEKAIHDWLPIINVGKEAHKTYSVIFPIRIHFDKVSDHEVDCGQFGSAVCAVDHGAPAISAHGKMFVTTSMNPAGKEVTSAIICDAAPSL